MKVSSLICGLDIGKTKVCAALGRVDDLGQVEILCAETSKAKGLQNGAVVDLSSITNSIGEVIERAEKRIGSRIRGVFTNLSGSHNIKGKCNRGIVTISDKGKEITRYDMEKALIAAKAVHIPLEREIVYFTPWDWVVDGQEGIRNPLGLYGSTLEVDLHIITALGSSIQNIIKCINQAGLEVMGITLSALASSLAVLTPEEKDLGVIMGDMGGDTTDISVFTKGRLRSVHVLPLGGDLITQAISSHFGVPFSLAEELKMGYRRFNTQAPNTVEQEMVRGFGLHKNISRKDLEECINSQIRQIFSSIKEELSNRGYPKEITSGVVITGGTSLMDGCLEIAESVLDLPVKIGISHGLVGGGSFANPLYTTSIGLVRYGTQYRKRIPFFREIDLLDDIAPGFAGRSFFGRLIAKAKDLFQEYF